MFIWRPITGFLSLGLAARIRGLTPGNTMILKLHATCTHKLHPPPKYTHACRANNFPEYYDYVLSTQAFVVVSILATVTSLVFLSLITIARPAPTWVSCRVRVMRVEGPKYLSLRTFIFSLFL